MLEVRAGLLLGSMGDALAVFTRVPSLVARYHVTHVLSLCNHPPEWIDNQLAPPDQYESGGSDSELKDVDEEEKISKEKSTKGWANNYLVEKLVTSKTGGLCN